MPEHSLFLLTVFAAAALGLYGMIELVQARRGMNALSRKLTPLHTEEARASRSAVRRLSLRLDASDYGRGWADRLQAAHIKLSPLQWLSLLTAAWLVISYLIASLLSLGFPYNLLIAYLAVNLGSKQLVKSRRQKFGEQINRQLPEICRMLSSCVRAGMSIQQGIDMVAREIKPPAGFLFQTMSRELQMGTGVGDVLERVHERFTSKDIRLMTQTILVQRQAGGNLGAALDHLARTLEERERVNREISNQTAESRYIAVTLALMPVFLVFVFNMVFKGFITPIFTLPGLILLAAVVVLMAIGFVLIQKVSRIKA
ncbi:hypothetical protein HGI30_03800 [Paenibacillus albicereus]|uniref:Type II secretion system protein GspF domain-containing protein n=1 Tax=Paenibacillus albicereus TaxID=2726185 RepID=A0A6H2GTL5_9BACL|nr:type II secretion system F family protein [Paenibacillus albicereus]QJC50774.1 hypothetical protein HGI30_03800 [Paenibacillus albicereus]